MDGVTDVRFCIEMGKLGGLGVINLEGVQTRYENPAEVLDQIVKAGKEDRHHADPENFTPSRSRRN
jgi:IMP dehydrogenase